MLVEESGIEMESPLVLSFRQCFEEGDFVRAEEILRMMVFTASIPLADRKAAFLLHEQVREKETDIEPEREAERTHTH